MKAQLSGNKNRGVSTLEILIAFAILTLSISAVIMVVFGNQSIAIDTQTNVEAISKAQKLLEEQRALSRDDFAAVDDIAETTDDVYTTSVIKEDINSSTKRVTSLVSWPAGGRSLSVKLSTILTDWLHPAPKCSPVITGNWKKPKVYGYVDFPSPKGGSDVFVGGSKAYVTSDPGSSSFDDFYIIDISDPELEPLPKLGHFSTTYGLTGVEVSGTNAFVTANSAVYQVLSIDLLDYNNLDVTKIQDEYDLTAPSDTAVGNTISRVDNLLYVGLTKSAGNEFRVIDASTPSSLSEVGTGFEVGAAVNQIVVEGTTAYLATASTTAHLIVLDVSDPSNPVLVDKKHPHAVLTGQSFALDTNTHTLYFGRIGGSANPKFLGLDTGDLATPFWTLDRDHNDGVYTMTLRSHLLFMTTAKPNDGLQIWDVSDPTSEPVRYETDPLNIQQGSTAGADCSGNLLYVAQQKNRAMQIVGPS